MTLSLRTIRRTGHKADRNAASWMTFTKKSRRDNQGSATWFLERRKRALFKTSLSTHDESQWLRESSHENCSGCNEVSYLAVSTKLCLVQSQTSHHWCITTKHPAVLQVIGKLHYYKIIRIVSFNSGLLWWSTTFSTSSIFFFLSQNIKLKIWNI